jgi:hypothetical protein
MKLHLLSSTQGLIYITVWPHVEGAVEETTSEFTEIPAKNTW